jgi:hypothetical protein
VKVWFIGRIDNPNMDRLFCGDTGWLQSDFEDTGEQVSVTMKEEPDPDVSCYSRHFKLLNIFGHSPKLTALLVMAFGLLTSNSYMWLNKRMKLYESSTVMSTASLHPLRKPLC